MITLAKILSWPSSLIKPFNPNKLAAWVGDHAKERILLRGAGHALETRDRDVLIAYIELAKLHQEYH